MSQAQAVATVDNPFAAARANAAAPSAAAHTDQQRAIAEVQAAMMIARANPRDPIAAMDRILNACQRPGLADAACYTYARGGTDITGPSIRLAETLAQCWGNLQFGIRELDQRGGESTVQAYAWDVETNTRREVLFQVPHVRYTRNATKRLEDPRDIYEMVANQGARRLRACVLAVIPGDVIEAAVAQCEATMKTTADCSPEAQTKIVEAFSKYGVTREQIEKRIQRRLDAIQPAQVVALKKIYASLRDGMSSPSEWFEVAEAQAPVTPATGADRLKAAAKKAAGKPLEDLAATEPKATPEPTAAPRGNAGPTRAEIEKQLQAARSQDIRDQVLDLARELPEADAKAVRVLYDQLSEERF